MNRYVLYARKSQEDEGRQQQSIPDQIRLMTEIAQRNGMTVVRSLEEQRSAKEPYQRQVFDSMMETIQAGEADSILCYHVNRLARNMVEGGLLQHLLTKGTLKEIRTYSEAFRTGDNILPFILQTAMSTQYSLDLSVHVKRGIRSKVEQGHYPERAPEGYINNLAEHSIDKDPERFDLLRRAWDLMLTGTYSIERLAVVMNTQWGYRTRKSRKLGGAPLAKSILHRIFNNVFYTGFFKYDGELYQGLHPAMVTFQEYEAVQQILHRHGSTRVRTREFAYTGMIVCARCGKQITAEHSRGRHGRGDYTYYHCTKYQTCRSKPVRQEVIERTIDQYLRMVEISPNWKRLTEKVNERLYQEESQNDQAVIAQQRQTLEDAERRMSKLIKLAMSDMISNDEFSRERSEIQIEINTLKQEEAVSQTRLDHAKQGTAEVVDFVTSAPLTFLSGSVARKREIARRLGASYKLRDGSLDVELNPLLIPIYRAQIEQEDEPIEPPKSDNSSTKNGKVDHFVPSGWTEGTLVGSLSAVWDLLFQGTPRMVQAKEDVRPRNPKGLRDGLTELS